MKEGSLIKKDNFECVGKNKIRRWSEETKRLMEAETRETLMNTKKKNDSKPTYVKKMCSDLSEVMNVVMKLVC